MTTNAMQRLAPWLLFAAFGCGSTPPAAYVSETSQAEAQTHRGEHRAAAEHYEQAARAASAPRDAEEARYRAAVSYARAGDDTKSEALLTELSHASTPGERRARAEIALADAFRRRGQAAEADQHYAHVVEQDPGSGVARAALDRHLEYLKERGGSDAVLAYLEQQSQRLAKTELGETAAYRRARELDESGKTAAARDAYLACAQTYPYPTGAFWDDALFRAAEKELALGAHERALEHLRRMLAEQESASILGSYQRGRYAEAQLKVAEIYRDQLHDLAGARRELRRVWEKHPLSRLVDDALFEEARLAHQSERPDDACAPLAILLEHRPDSRYVGCAPLLCTRLKVEKRDCHDYIKRAAGL